MKKVLLIPAILMMLVNVQATASSFDKNSVFKDGSKVSDVYVSVDTELISAEGRRAFRENDVVSDLRDSIISTLKSKNKYSVDGSLKIDIVVNFVIILVGELTGVDKITADVLLIKKGKPFKQFPVRGTTDAHINALKPLGGHFPGLIKAFKFDLINKLYGQKKLPNDTSPKRGLTIASASQNNKVVVKKTKKESVKENTADKSVKMRSQKPSMRSVKGKLKKLKHLHKSGLISDGEYAEQKSRVLDSM